MRAIRAIRTAAAARIPGIPSSADPTGSGKTVFIGFLVAMLERQGATQVVFDKDRGLEILVRALGGEYLRAAGTARPTGFNPLQLPPHARARRVPEDAGCACWCGRQTAEPLTCARAGGPRSGAARARWRSTPARGGCRG